MIYELFAEDPPELPDGLRKYRNCRSLICALKDFHRLYEVLSENSVPDIEQYLYSFITSIIISKNGISKDGKSVLAPLGEEIIRLYPGCRPDKVPACSRQWIDFGIWDDDEILKHITEKN